MTNTVRWALVGTGFISRQIAPDFERTENSRIVAVGSRSTENASSFAGELGIERHYSDFTNLLADPEIDAVYLGTPTAVHSEQVMQGIKAGKHVLVEKPLAATHSEALKVAAAAARRAVFVMEGMWMKSSPVYKALLGDIRNGAVGEVRSVRDSFGLPPLPRRTAPTGSSLQDRGIYSLTLCHDVFGPPIRIIAGGVIGEDRLDAEVHATLEYDGGRFAHVAASRGLR